MKSLKELAIAKLATVTASDVAVLEPKVILPVIERIARAVRVGRKIVRIDRQLVGKPGRKVIIAKIGGVTFSPVAEGALPTEVEATVSSIEVTVEKYGAMVKITKEAVETAQIDLIRTYIEEVGHAWAEAEDEDIIDTLRAGAGNTITTTTFDYASLLSAAAWVKAQKRQPDVAVMSPARMEDIVKDTRFLDSAALKPGTPLVEGAIGRLAGLSLLVTTQIPDYWILVLDTRHAGCLVLKREIDLFRKEEPDWTELHFFAEWKPAVRNSEAICLISIT